MQSRMKTAQKMCRKTKNRYQEVTSRFLSIGCPEKRDIGLSRTRLHLVKGCECIPISAWKPPLMLDGTSNSLVLNVRQFLYQAAGNGGYS